MLFEMFALAKHGTRKITFRLCSYKVAYHTVSLNIRGRTVSTKAMILKQ
jgi:hypothetical protein